MIGVTIFKPIIKIKIYFLKNTIKQASNFKKLKIYYIFFSN